MCPLEPVRTRMAGCVLIRLFPAETEAGTFFAGEIHLHRGAISTRQFIVFVEDKLGELARVTEALAQSAVNIRGLATDRVGPRPAIKVITDDEHSTRKALQRAGMEFEETEVLVVDLIDRPGEIAKVARRVARAGVNVDSVYLIGKKDTPAAMAIGTADQKKAKKLLEE